MRLTTDEQSEDSSREETNEIDILDKMNPGSEPRT